MSIKKSIPSQEKELPITVLLIDDQRLVAEAVRLIVEEHSDIAFHYCSDPSDAVKMADAIHPTVILQDLVMPKIDGLTLVKTLRLNPSTKDVPLIVLSVNEDPKVKAEAFALGANDYAVKLPDKVELVARIRYHSAAYTRLLQRNEAYQKLEESKQQLYQELFEAAQYVRSLLPSGIDEGQVRTRWLFLPSTQLGGDIFQYHKIGNNYFALYLLDVCGHGVGAALLSIAVMNILRNQSLAGVDFLDPGAVLTKLNETFPMEKHNNMFFTIWYGIFDTENRTLRYSSGGHPPAILVEREEIYELSTPNVMVGALPGAEFISQERLVPEHSFLYVFSDGIYEHSKEGGGMHSIRDFIRELSKVSKKPLEEQLKSIEQFIEKIGGQAPYPDDVSLLIAAF